MITLDELNGLCWEWRKKNRGRMPSVIILPIKTFDSLIDKNPELPYTNWDGKSIRFMGARLVPDNGAEIIEIY